MVTTTSGTNRQGGDDLFFYGVRCLPLGLIKKKGQMQNDDFWKKITKVTNDERDGHDFWLMKLKKPS